MVSTITSISFQLPSVSSSSSFSFSSSPKADLTSTLQDDKNSDDPLRPSPEQIQKLQQHRSNSTSSSSSSSSSVSTYSKQLDLISAPPLLHCNASPHRYNSDATNAILEDQSSPFTLSHATATEVQNINSLHNTSAVAAKPISRKNSLKSPSSPNDNKQPPVVAASLPSSLFLSSSTASTTPYYTLAASRLPPNASTQVHYYTESPVMIEMKQFGATDASSIPSPSPTSEGAATSSTVIEMPGADYHDLVEESKRQHPFFRGWLQIPPSLAGRPTLTPEQEQRLRHQIENGPVQSLRAPPQRKPEVYGAGHVESSDDHSLSAAPPSAATVGKAGGYLTKLWGMGGGATKTVVESPATISNLGDEVITTVPAPDAPTAIAAGGDRDSRRGAMGV